MCFYYIINKLVTCKFYTSFLHCNKQILISGAGFQVTNATCQISYHMFHIEYSSYRLYVYLTFFFSNGLLSKRGFSSWYTNRGNGHFILLWFIFHIFFHSFVAVSFEGSSLCMQKTAVEVNFDTYPKYMYIKKGNPAFNIGYDSFYLCNIIQEHNTHNTQTPIYIGDT